MEPVSYPALDDPASVRHFRTHRTLFLIRGPPGSGKSTLAASLLARYTDSHTCSADHYFRDPTSGEYRFDRTRLSEAHAQCRAAAERACADGVGVVVIDNTNAAAWEMTQYYVTAARHGYTPVVLEPRTSWCSDVTELVRRNMHGADAECVTRRLERARAQHPGYYGWFVGAEDAGRLEAAACEAFNVWSARSTQFSRQIGEGKDTLRKRYGVGAQPHLHCTSFYSGFGERTGSEAYRRTSEEYLGRQFDLQITGILITPRTVGLRVQLSEQQLTLWAQQDQIPSEGASSDKVQKLDEDIGTPTPTEKLDSPKTSESRFSTSDEVLLLTEEVKTTLNLNQDESLAVKQNQNTSNDNMSKSWTAKVGDRAHITLGFSDGIHPVETGFDLLKFLRNNEITTENEVFECDSGTCMRYDDSFYVRLKDPICISSVFTSFYKIND